MNAKISFLWIVLMGLNVQTAWAQLKVPKSFQSLLMDMNADLMTPLDAGYRVIRLLDNRVQNCQLGLWSRKEKLEIRYLIQAYDKNDKIPQYPHLAAKRLILHLGSNDEDTYMTARDLTDLEREELFNVDWGKVYLFRPKLSFSARQYCKLVALFKEGQGLAYIFYLFDEPSPAIDNRLYTFRFNDQLEK